MRLGIMQPYFFPYIGYWQLINYCDRFILFDTPQYIRHGWINRNRIINQKGEPIYIVVPIKKTSRDTAIKDIEIDQEINWKDKIFGQLTVYKKRAPYYKEIIGLVDEALTTDERKINKLNEKGIRIIANYLGIKTPIDVFSEMDMQIEGVNAPDEWALNITKKLGFDEYINPPGGQGFFDEKKYVAAGIELYFLEPQFNPYVQKINRFVEGLSIIDVMMFCGRDSTKKMMGEFKLCK